MSTVKWKPPSQHHEGTTTARVEVPSTTRNPASFRGTRYIQVPVLIVLLRKDTSPLEPCQAELLKERQIRTTRAETMNLPMDVSTMCAEAYSGRLGVPRWGLYDEPVTDIEMTSKKKLLVVVKRGSQDSRCTIFKCSHMFGEDCHENMIRRGCPSCKILEHRICSHFHHFNFGRSIKGNEQEKGNVSRTGA